MSCSNLARPSVSSRCLGPLASAEMKGSEILDEPGRGWGLGLELELGLGLGLKEGEAGGWRLEAGG